ncbi:SUN domain-containing protein 2 [Melia azedarach]|uniref:SUN domain-containing protein 2 n=1 Tax=Melia azedarach TaxID=155640 RepID=A0ACC1WYE2_MELAZ|nr:SUN domain-containing protein 2 [Melia azedarach]
MDKNLVLAVFFLFLVVADASKAKFRKLAAAPPENNSTLTQVLGKHNPNPQPVDAATKPENDQVRNNSSQLDTKPLNNTELVSSPPQSQATDSRGNLNSTNLDNSPPVQDQTMNNERGPKGFNNTDDGKNLKNSSSTDLLSPPINDKDTGKIPQHVNDTDLLSPPIKEKDKGENVGKETVNGRNGRTKEDHIDNKSSSPAKETGNGKNGGFKENNIDDKRATDEGKNGGNKEKSIDDKNSSELGVNETCDGLNKCTDLRTLVACIQNFDTAGSRELTVLVQNDGENTLRVNVSVPTAVENPLKPLQLPKHQAQKINISLSVVKNTKLTLNAGYGECVLHMDHPESEKNAFVYLPSYDNLVTPINGAYFLILSVLVFGGTWACCKFRKRRWNDGVPYQELEMGVPESVSATNIETAEGWDQGWDDDWDDDNAVKSPAARIGSISANGLTSRSPNRDGWEQDWDD